MVDITEPQLEEVINRFKGLVTVDKYKIASGENREKNDNFITKYFITTNRLKKMLLELTTKDCISVEKHNKDKNKIVYIFVKEYNISTRENRENVKVYIKFTLCLLRCQDYAIVISFHEQEGKEKEYLFK